MYLKAERQDRGACSRVGRTHAFLVRALDAMCMPVLKVDSRDAGDNQTKLLFCYFAVPGIVPSAIVNNPGGGRGGSE